MSGKKKAGIVVAVAICVCGMIGGYFFISGSAKKPYDMSRAGTAQSVSGEKDVQKDVPEQEPVSGQEAVSAKKAGNSRKKDVIKRGKVGMGSYESFSGRSFAEVVAEHTEDNVLYSPVNLYLTLGMLANSSSGETQREILEAMKAEDWLNTCGNLTEKERLEGRVKTVEQICVNLLREQGKGKKNPKIQNSIWLRDSVPLHEKKLSYLQRQFDMDVFRGKMDDEMKEALQNWLNKATGGKLKDDVKGIEFPPQTMCVIFSTLLFEDKWAKPFESEYTEKRKFYEQDGTVTKADFMTDTSWMVLEKKKNYRSLKLNFGESDADMTIYLPNKNISVDEMLAKEQNQLMKVVERKDTEDEDEEEDKEVHVELAIPKFEIHMGNNNLEPVLKRMGIRQLFGGEADLSPLFRNAGDGIGVDSIKQSSRIKVNEGGCSVASYTVGTLDGFVKVKEKNEFICNRPFVYVIRNKAGIPVFAGVVRSVE